MKRNRPPQKKPGVYRIIGGQWRSRRLNFVEVEGLRPTTDRVRETLFNWLAPEIEGAVVLDLFAGSGALGFEALSRGAEKITLLELDRSACQTLRDNAAILNATATITQADTLVWLAQHPVEDIDIFLADPPFRKGIADHLLNVLSEKSLKPGCLLYLETEREWSGAAPSARWQMLKEKEAGQVCYRLLKYVAAD